ncbi:hypothetical protein [Undibacterium sp. Tian12W]|uniref:hypothetical protein n=1 Tax=Undibacterium sp. Tian12W TaxID=3413054 RepID=UPI003BF5F974
MAIWHFEFSLIPTAGICKAHGKMVDFLPEYGRHQPDAPLLENDDFFNYWAGSDLSSGPVRLLEQLLPHKTSWSSDARMYGSKEQSQLEVWDDGIHCAFNVANLDVTLLTAIVNIAHDLDCKLALKDGGRLIDPDTDMVIEALRDSLAWKFVKDPEGVLTRGEHVIR